MDILGFLTAVPNWLVILVGIPVALYIYYSRKFTFWSSRGVKQLNPIPIFGDILGMFYKTSFEIDLEQSQKVGRIYGVYEGTNPALVVGEPELIRKILLQDFHVFPNRRDANSGGEELIDNMFPVFHGDKWKSMRAIVSQTFSSGKMRKMSTLLEDCAETLKEHLREAAENNDPIECKRLLNAFTMDSVARCAFGIKVDSLKDPNNPFIKYATKVFGQNQIKNFLISTFVPNFLRKLLGITMLNHEVSDFFLNVSRQIIKERKGENEERNDYLQLIINASDLKSQKDIENEEEGENPELGVNYEQLAKMEKENAKFLEVPSLKKQAFTEMEVLAQCLMFFAAGVETVTACLSYCFYQLAVESEVQAKLQKEVDKIYEQHGGVNYDVLVKMPYLDAFVSEVLRLNNPATRLERLAEEDYQLGDTGIIVPKGTVVIIPVHVIHHDPEWYPDPYKFDPERFLPENKNNITPYTYLPFGSGPRNCVAMRFALMETKLTLAKVVRHFQFQLCPETKTLKFHPGAQLMQPIKIILKVQKRS